jgi:thymidine kinase
MTERLEVISGSMFSGKTKELQRLVGRQEYAGVKAQIFKPIIDIRWGKTEKVRAHSGEEKAAIPVKDSAELLSRVDADTKYVAIDEAQFFDEGIIKAVDQLLDRNIKVLVAGLPLDFRGVPFGSMPILLAKADNIIKLTAICTEVLEDGKKCGVEATKTQRILNGKPANYTDPIILIGAAENYAARCPNHHVVPGKPKPKANDN